MFPWFHDRALTCAHGPGIGRNFTPFLVQQCNLAASNAEYVSDLNMGSTLAMSRAVMSLNRMLALGAAGFRIYSAASIGPQHLALVWKQLNQLQPRVQQVARQAQPVIILELWPYQMLQDPALRPISPGPSEDPIAVEMPYLLTALPFLRANPYLFVTDHAWTFQVSRAFLCGIAGYPPCDGSHDLREMTAQSAAPEHRWRSAEWPISLNVVTRRVVRSLNQQDLHAFAFQRCVGEKNSTAGGVIFREVCPKVPMQWHDPAGTMLANIWLMALPGGPATVFSSYEWHRDWSFSEAIIGGVKTALSSGVYDRNWFTGRPLRKWRGTAVTTRDSHLCLIGRLETSSTTRRL